jgi:signal peptidase I
MTLRKWILLSVVFSMLVGCGGPWSSGDRVLVSKCAYDNGFVGPHRYEVVVFKFPEGPMDKNTPKNYIKRLMGLPGELLAIFFGRVYRWTPPENAPPPFDDVHNAAIDPLHLWEKAYTHTNDEKSREWFEAGQFEILRKPPHAMLALRRIVYDNDFQAKDLKGKLDRWNPDAKSGWKSDKETGFTHEAKAGDQVDWLRYQHLLRPEGFPIAGGDKERPRLITDTMAYNSFKSARRDHTPHYPHWVGDLLLECNVEVIQPKGDFLLELSKGIYRYQARWDLATGQCTLLRIGLDGKHEELAIQSTSVKSPGNYMLRFANVDARLSVWVDRSLPFGDGKAYDPPEVRAKNEGKLDEETIKKRCGPEEKNDLQPASIGSKAAQVKITHVRLWRDTYYTTSASDPDYKEAINQLHGELPRDVWSTPAEWTIFRKQDFATMYVQPGHYLCLGDNSQASSDSRQWGVVPERLMLGRALVVYYPLDRIGPIH